MGPSKTAGENTAFFTFYFIDPRKYKACCGRLALLKAQVSLQLGTVSSSDNGVSVSYNVLIHVLTFIE